MATAVVLYGPKAAGKSWAADVLRSRLGVHHIDADPLVLELIARGVGPDPREGWMAWVEHAAAEALRRHRAVSVEATGAWDSDWELSRRLEAAGARVIRVWIWAPEEETIERLARRTKNAAPITKPKPAGSTPKRPLARAAKVSTSRSTLPGCRTPTPSSR